LLTALVVMGGALWLASGSDAAWLAHRLSERLIRLGVMVGLGVIAYFATLWVLGFRLNDFKRRAA
jgi:putative peptidoglycan lipid II flippase